LIEPPGKITHGSVKLEGRELVGLRGPEMRRIRGGKISMVFQDPMTALNPVLTIGTQITETILAHQSISASEARRDAIMWLDRVRIPEAKLRMRQYPYELSGGMRQRVLLSMAFALRPAVLIADEPTTALDVTVQSQILDLIDDMRRETGTAVLLVTHDLGVVAERCDRVCVMYAGRVVETAPTQEIFFNPRHPYSQALMACLPEHWHGGGNKGRTLPFLAGQPPKLLSDHVPTGCAFAPRCALVRPKCHAIDPEVTKIGAAEHQVRCIVAQEAAHH
jgi:peptide/nickel transport system ATP-binding protein